MSHIGFPDENLLSLEEVFQYDHFCIVFLFFKCGINVNHNQRMQMRFSIQDFCGNDHRFLLQVFSLRV